MDTMTLENLTLEDLLPHRGRMMLIGEVLEVDGDHARTVCQVDRSWPMAEDEGVHALILVELAAQSAGIFNGWNRVQVRGRKSDPMGMLVGVKKAELHIDLLPFDSRVVSWAENTFTFANLREVSCRQYVDDRLVGRMTLQVFQAREE